MQEKLEQLGHNLVLKIPPSYMKEESSMKSFINSKWVEQIFQSFYYIEDQSECISRWMLKMMKDKTSFWFDNIKYIEIRNDYK